VKPLHYMRGRVARQAHVDIPEGTVEEEFGRQGFAGRYAHIYRTQPPVGWTRIEGPCKPRALRLDELGPGQGDYLADRVTVLENQDCKVGMARLAAAMPYHFRNADADELHFVHAGTGRLETDFGPLQYRTGDYLVIPRGTVYRFLPDSPSRFLLVETTQELTVPDRGLLGHTALFDPALIEVPEPEAPAAPVDGEEWELRIQRCGELTSVFYPFHPITTVGWKGDLTVWKLNVADIRPVLSDRYHLPPSAHATFVTESVIVVTFLPRPLENGDPAALKVPFYHSNIDFDEVIFYHRGEFFSRDGVGAGMLTFHPQGIHHGPQPAAVKAAEGKTRTDEVAVMIDTVNPLKLTDAARDVEWADYWKSWRNDG